MAGASREKTRWVTCANCGHDFRKHRILYEKQVPLFDEATELKRDYHRLVECMGCESIRYVISIIDLMNYDQYEGPTESIVRVYPDSPNKPKRQAISIENAIGHNGKLLIPTAVWKMYRETIDALNTNILTLAGGGLRAVVEAICLDKKIENGTLEKKIDSLVQKTYLTSAQAELLHEERYIGNAALHELATPSVNDIEDGLGIVEGLINTIYILPHKAERLKSRRTAKSRAKAKRVSKPKQKGS